MLKPTRIHKQEKRKLIGVFFGFLEVEKMIPNLKRQILELKKQILLKKINLKHAWLIFFNVKNCSKFLRKIV